MSFYLTWDNHVVLFCSGEPIWSMSLYEFEREFGLRVASSLVRDFQ